MKIKMNLNMKTSLCQLRCLFSVVGLTLALPLLATEGGVVHDGGDVLYVDDQIKMFEEVECSQGFSPDTSTDPAIKDAFALIQAQLNILSKKLPSSASHIQRVFSNGTAFWCFAQRALVEVDDEGSTSLAIYYDKVQVAIHQRGTIKIRHDLWDRMDNISRANLLLHESLWVAVGPEHISSGAQIRQLTSLLMSPSLDNFTAENLARFMRQQVRSASKLAALVDYDLRTAGGLNNYQVEEVVSDRSVDTVVIVNNSGSIHNGKRLTKLNPNPLYPYIWASRDHSLWVDLPTRSLDTPRLVPMNWHTILNTKDLCGRMTYGGATGWRLPTLTEMQDLIDLELLQWNYINRTYYFRVASTKINAAEVQVSTSSYLFPTEYGLPVVTADLKIVDLKDNLRDDSKFYGAASSSMLMPRLTYPSYFCIHD